MLNRIALLAIAAPRRVLVLSALVMVAAAIFGIPVAKSLSAGGFQDPTSESARATQLLTDKFHQGDMQLIFTVSSPDGVTSPGATAVAEQIAGVLRRSPHVAQVTSAWTVPPGASGATGNDPGASGATGNDPGASGDLVSKDKTAGLIVAGITGGENNAQKYAKELSDSLMHVADGHPGVTIKTGGTSMVYAQINAQTERDLLLMESIAIPLSFLVLVWVFGGLVAAALPMIVGGMAIVGTMSVLRLITFSTDVSIFALNLSTAMGLALAIDYTLLIISRYRDELAEGQPRDRALIRTMATAGRTVLFSATTVALSMAAMLLFPMYFLKSFAYAGVATVGFAALAAIVVAPAAIWLLGERLDALDVRWVFRRVVDRSPKPVEQQFWYRWTGKVMRRAVPVGLAVVALLVLLGAPFLGVKWGFPDDRVLPASASARQVGDQLRNDFTDNSATAVTAVIPDADGLTPAEFDRYATELSRVADVSSVAGPTGTFVDGRKVGPAGQAGIAEGSAFLTVGSTAPLFSDASERQLDALHAVTGPDGRTVELGGIAQINRDSVTAITTRLPWVLGVIAVITFGLLFLLTGSVVLPLKALVLNVLSLTAAFGALVWIFQDGHLSALGTTPTGTLVANMPVLLFCIAFGLSMDYEVFLAARIREYWLALDGPARQRNDKAVALGLARTGKVITAAALVMSITFAALIAAQVSFMRMFGVGLTLAVLVDATLVRMVLVPAFMHVAGRWNWWAPAPLVWLHQRIGISESGPDSERREPVTAGVTDTGQRG
ncbi:MMPL family transporter [Mycolicibacterium cosmeticum]|uniref:Integral membrane protein n=1 Tax=Mycolicibacterium cosmeticum TaxID=258533 RepID=W9AMN6_MYCCO|nr:MMPL family transporter [Mycolicibacterium cosmeticum]TLH66514.1 MMPL family transporter [Mycolicibacterium cosmeticum]CDO06733.1 integral membrane protein [Mycolicibacterium cosmeticum]